MHELSQPRSNSMIELNSILTSAVATYIMDHFPSAFPSFIQPIICHCYDVEFNLFPNLTFTCHC